MLNASEAIEKFLDFEKRANAKRSTQIDRIKEDRKFLSGDQWDISGDDKMFRKRTRRTINILGNACNSVVSQYDLYPYKWYTGDDEADGCCEAFLHTGSNSRAPIDVLRSSVSFGLGYFALGSEAILDENGEEVEIPSLYSIDKVENVYVDPDSVSVTGEDMMECAIVETRSKNYIRAKYGDKWAPRNGIKAHVNVTDNLNSDMMPIVTYFRMEDGRCVVYTLLNDDFLQDPVPLELSRIPVFPVYGEATWDGDNIIYQGLVRKGAPIQRLVNYAYTNLSERMAFAPKPIFLTIPEAVENFDEGYKNFGNNLNPLLLYNPSSEDGKVQYPEPKKLDNTMEFSDITGIISSNLELMSTVVGVDSKGILNDAPQLTATEVIYNEKQFNNATRHYFTNLRDSFRAVGECVLKLLNYGNVPVEVIQGPSEYMEKQVARQELISLAGIVPDQDKMKIVDGILLSHNENPILRNVFGAIHAMPQQSPVEQQAFATIEEMKKAIGEKDARIMEMEDQIKNYESYMNNNDKNIQADLIKLDMQHQNKMEEMALQSELDAGKDGGKAAIEAQKAQIDLQKSAIQLDETEMKANAEIAKAVFGGNVNEN